jgi:hypothetical protein
MGSRATGRRRLALVVIAVSIPLLAAGCGGSSKHATHPRRPPAHGVGPASTKPLPVLTAVARAIPGAAGTPTSRARVRAGGGVALLIQVRPPHGSAPGKLTVTVPTGKSKSLVVRAKYGRYRAKATVVSATGRPIDLLRVSFNCSLRPATVTCPKKPVSSKSKANRVTFDVTGNVTEALLATAGPTTVPTPKLIPPGPIVVPPYAVTELLQVVQPRPKTATKKASPPPPPAPTVTVRPGDFVTMGSSIRGAHGGAMQPVTVTINQGPGNSLTIKAQTPGGVATPATIKSASGSPIALVLPTYGCYLPPYPTFCPAVSTKLRPHQYQVTFEAGPGTVHISMRATVVPG